MIEKKRLKKKKQVIGKIQLLIGILLIIGVISGGIISYNLYKNKTNENDSMFNNGIKNLKETTFLSNETKYLGALDYSTYYLEQHLQITLGFINLGLIFILIMSISILFITQGLINLSTTNN